MRYLARRLAFYLLAAWAAVTLNFFIPRLAPGDPAAVLVAKLQGRLDPAALASLKEAYGISDQPLIVQYFEYLGNILHGDFGVSISQFPATVTDVISGALGWSLLLGTVSLVISYVLGSAVGVLAAWRRGGWFDRIVTPALVFIGSFPYFFLALLLIFGFAVILQWLPIGQATSGEVTPGWTPEYLADAGVHLLLPVITMVLVSVGSWALNMRNVMVSIIDEDYLTLAEAKGLSTPRVVGHAVRNALLPSITLVGAALGGVFGGQILTEAVFSYPGLGYMLLQAVESLDYPLMQALFLIITIAVLAANFVVDSVYTLLDPRVRIEAVA